MAVLKGYIKATNQFGSELDVEQTFENMINKVAKDIRLNRQISKVNILAEGNNADGWVLLHAEVTIRGVDDPDANLLAQNLAEAMRESDYKNYVIFYGEGKYMNSYILNIVPNKSHIIDNCGYKNGNPLFYIQ